MKDIELLQSGLFEQPNIMELKNKLNEVIRDVNHLNSIVSTSSLTIKTLQKDMKNLALHVRNL